MNYIGRNSLTEGDFGNGFYLCQSLVEGDFWTRSLGCYQIYCGCGHIDAIDYEQIVASSSSKGFLILPTYLNHTINTDYFYSVRYASDTGKEEQGTMSIIKLSLDEEGKQRVSRPNHVCGLKAEVVTNGCIRLSWWYWPIGQQIQPNHFAIFGDNATGTINYNQVLANIMWNNTVLYTYTSAPGIEGHAYRFSVRTVDADGNDDGNTGFVEAIVDLTGPAKLEDVNSSISF